MELKTILNRVCQLPGFVYGRIRLVRAAKEGERDRIEVEVRPRANGRALCSGFADASPLSTKRLLAWFPTTVANIRGVTTIGVDEIAWQSGHRYLTLVYQLDAGCRRLLWVGQERKITTLESFFEWFGKERSARLQVVCSDMWKAYLRVVQEQASQAKHVLDRFHIVQKLGKAIDKVRAAEAKQLQAKGEEPVLKSSRWLLLKRPERLTEKQEPKLAELLKLNLRTVRAYLLKEDFQLLWDCRSPRQANKFLKRWCRRATRSRIQPMQKVAKMLRKHRPLLLNWFRTGRAFSSGAVEGMNNKAKVALRKAYGFRSYKSYELALYHTLGNLPQHSLAHRFC